MEDDEDIPHHWAEEHGTENYVDEHQVDTNKIGRDLINISKSYGNEVSEDEEEILMEDVQAVEIEHSDNIDEEDITYASEGLFEDWDDD